MSSFGPTSDLTKLVERSRRQDSDAWAILVDRFSDFVFSVARRYRLNDEDASDVMLATFQALYSNINSISEPETLPKWLAVTAARLSLRAQRESGKTAGLDTALDLNEMIAADDESAEEAAVQACQAAMIRDAVASLGGRCAPLLQMLYLSEDSSYLQASEKLGIPMGAISPTRARCLQKLRKLLIDAGFFE
jgi:RNA polymerase sigma factor (sigma-70 family)